jgi:hypothetical protein
VPDPAAVEGSEDDKRAAFAQAFDALAARIHGLLARRVAQPANR